MKGLKRWFACAAAAAWLGLSPLALPQAHAEDKEDLKALLQRLDKLEKQNQQLQQRLQDIETPVIQESAGAVAPGGKAAEGADLKKAIDTYLKEKDDKKKAEDEAKKKQAELEGTEVGHDLKMSAKWDHGLWLETADKAFKVHVGGRTQYDTIFYQAGDAVMFGNNGVGRVDDASAFRRARLAV